VTDVRRGGNDATVSAADSPGGAPPPGGTGEVAHRTLVPVAATAGAMTMVALCFANGLQGGAAQTFAQVTEALKHTYHVNDAAIGAVPFGVSIMGNLGAVPVAALCVRFKRTTVLAGMFVIWGTLMTLAGMAPVFSFLGFASAGFVLFAVFRIASALTEATDPATLPLIADWWPATQRAKKVSIFNTLSAVGTIVGLIGAGVMVDTVGWRPAFVIWLPLALLGAALIKSRAEPERGAQDAAFARELEEDVEGEERLRVIEVVEGEAEEISATLSSETSGHPWHSFRVIARIRSWRLAAIGISVTGLMGTGIQTWGLAYFKRTFGMSATEAGALAPILGIGAFAGVLGGGYLADRLLAKGMLRARLHVTVAGFAGAGLVYVLAFSTTNVWIAAPLLAVAAALSAIPLGPQFALLMDVTPAPLRSQASAALNVLQATGALGPLLIGLISTALGENLRLALLCVSPFYVIGAAIVFLARETFVEEVAAVVAEARGRIR
jgi:MFS transporter, Spinster family, sphingosine-1-phosphate transporter